MSSLSGSHNRPSGRSVEELTEVAVQALVREWGVTEMEARAAIERARSRERQFGPEIARRRVWDEPLDLPGPREPIDLTGPRCDVA